MHDASATSPLLFLPYLLCLVLMAYPAFRIISLYLDGEITTLALVLMLGSLLALMAGIGRTWGSPTGGLLLLLLVLLCIGIPALNALAERRLGQKLLDEDIEKCQQALRFDPSNVYAHSRLGDIHLSLRQYDEAIQWYYEATRLAPNDQQEKRKLQYAIERKRRAEVQSVFCPRCRAENASHAEYCRECSFPLSAKREIMDALRGGMGHDLLKWIAIGSGILLVVGAVMRPVPLSVVGGAGLVLACVALLYLYLQLRE